MESVELLKQAAFQRGFEKQSSSILAGLGKSVGKSVGGLGSKLWQIAKPKPNPLFAPVFNPQAVTSVAQAAPKFNSKELMRLEKLIASMNQAKPVAMAPAFNSKELMRLEKLIASMNKGKASKPGLIATNSGRSPNFSTGSSLSPIGFTMGGPKIF
tara:strand:+ start:495 stop:962 length:468 start_codon:yes stop_codon:yes gene_type:complete